MIAESSISLITIAVLAVRPEYREELNASLRDLQATGFSETHKLYEVCLQTYLFAGFPAALESVRCLETVFGSVHGGSIKSEQELAAEYGDFIKSGKALYQTIYGANAERVKSELLRLSPELAAWALIEGYGKTLSRSGLDTVTRELCIVAQLTDLGWHRQLYSHILGARNSGAMAEDIVLAIRIGSRDDQLKYEHAEQLVKKLV